MNERTKRRTGRRWIEWLRRTLRLTCWVAIPLSLSFSLNFCDPRSPLAIGLPGPSDPNSHLEGADDLGQLRRCLAEIAREESSSMHRMLWRGTTLVRGCALYARWDEVLPWIESLGLEQRVTGGCGGPTVDLSCQWAENEYLVPGVGFESPGGLWHDLTVSFHTRAEDDGPVVVADASVGLRCRIDRPYQEVLDRGLYRRDGIATAFLTAEDAVEQAAHYPHLVDVAFHFAHTVHGFISRWGATIDSGIEACASFEVDEGPDRQGESWVRLEASSGLVPTRTWAGNFIEWRLSPDESVGRFFMSGFFPGGRSGWNPEDG